jgi:hypothetical protein
MVKGWEVEGNAIYKNAILREWPVSEPGNIPPLPQIQNSNLENDDLD